MGTVKDFEDLEIWKMARKLVNLVYSDFRDCREYGFKDQKYVTSIISTDRRNKT
jgi:hypothetical protein